MSAESPANPELATCEVHGVTRASFILRGALATGAMYGMGAVAPFVSSAFAQGATSDVDILNFALTLEYLEADFYTVKGKQVGLSGTAKRYAKQFGEEEQAHVTALQATIIQLGGKPVKKPTFVFPVTDEMSFLKLAATLEDTGVSAYNGAAPSIQDKKVLASAGAIVQVEARHAAAISLLLENSPTPDGGFDKPLDKAQVLKAAGPLIKA
jgi:rubrerythrin